MYLSDHDLEDAVRAGRLIVKPPPAMYDTTSIDLHLDTIATAMVWNAAEFESDQKIAGVEFPVLGMKFHHKQFAKKYHQPVPTDKSQRVYRDGDAVVLKPHGFSFGKPLKSSERPKIIPSLSALSTARAPRRAQGCSFT